MFKEFRLLATFSLKDRKYIAPFKEILCYTFEEINKEDILAKKVSEEALDKITIKLDRLEERFIFEEISKEQYNRFRQKLEKEKAEKEQELHQNSFESSNLEKSIDKALEYASNLPLLWESGDIETKRKLQYMVFPDGIEYDFKNDAVRTSRVNVIFNAISLLSGNFNYIKKENSHHENVNSLLVESGRFELPSKQGILKLSTRLVFV